MGDSLSSLGQATAVTSGGGLTTYTMNASKGVTGVRRGEYYDLYDSTLATIRAGGPYKLSAIDWANRKLTFTGIVTGAAATDQVVFEGSGGIANPPGLKGLLYHNNTAESGTTHGVNRALEPELWPNKRDASGRPTFQMGEQMAHQIFVRRSIDSGMPEGIKVLCPVGQQANIRENVMDIANFNLAQGKLNADLMPQADMNFNFAGVPAILDRNQLSDRLDYFVPGDWSIAQIDPPGFFEIEGRKIHPVVDTATGVPTAQSWFALYSLQDFLCHDFGHAAVIYNCSQPTY